MPEGSRLGPYLLDRELGAGGMGRVYAAQVEGRAPSVAEGSRVALKVVHPQLLQADGFFQRFLREAEIGQRVRHPNVVRTYSCDQIVTDEAHHTFLVMEYVEGQTLRELLEDVGRVPEELCRHVALEICAGLGAIHDAGVVHRDVKLENVLITPDHQVKVMDLGVAKLQDEVVRLSQTGAFIGSIHCAAPEQLGRGPVDARCDLHALGVLLYELASGRHPFIDDDARVVMGRILSHRPRGVGAVNPQVSAFFEEVVARLLQKDPDDRFQSAAEVRGVLRDGEDSSWWRQRATVLRGETREPLRAVRVPRETAIYGRDAEMSRLRECVARASAGEGQVVLIEGEAGIGKTRLVDELVAQLVEDGEDVNFLFGSYPPGGAATAAGAFSTAFREQFGSEDLDRTLATYLQPTPALVPAFAALLTGDMSPPDTEPLTKDSLQTVFVHATRALARERTTIILIDDLHFAPPEGLALWIALAQAVVDDRVLLIGTTRPGLSAEWATSLDRLPNGHRMEIGRLGAKDLGELLVDAFSSRRVAEVLALKIAEKSDGNPFFVFEILRGMRERGILRREEDGSWWSTGDIRDFEIPSTLRDLVQVRINDLGSDADRDVLEVASCCGFAFDPLVVGRVLGLDDIPLLRRLGRIEHTSRLVRAQGRRFVFDHHQVQETLYESVSPLLRERYHAALGSALEDSLGAAEGRDVRGECAVELAHHFLLGGEARRALSYVGPAADHLAGAHLYDDALQLVGRALAAPDLIAGAERLDLLLRCDDWLNTLGRSNERERFLYEALDLAESSADPARRALVRIRLGASEMLLGRATDAVPILEEALELSRDADDTELEGRALSLRGQCIRMLGETDAAIACYEAAMQLALDAGDPMREANAARGLGSLCQQIDRMEDARRHRERDLELSQAHGGPRAVARALGNLASTLEEIGLGDQAARHRDECIRIARTIGDRRTEMIALFNRASEQMDGDADDREKARLGLERVRRLAREVGFVRAEGAALGNLGLLHRSSGRLDIAVSMQREQLRHGRLAGNVRTVINAHINLGEVYTLLGALDAARAECETAIRDAIETKHVRLEYFAKATAALAAEAGERLEDAEAWFRQVAEHCRASIRGPGLAGALAFLGRVVAAQGRQEEAAEILREALTVCRDCDDTTHGALAAAELAGVEGDVEAARAAARSWSPSPSLVAELGAAHTFWRTTGDREHLDKAARLLGVMRESCPPEYERSIVENVAMHREIVAAIEGGERG